QSDDVATPIGGGPIKNREYARQELQGGDEGYDAQVGQVLLGAQHQIEAVAGHDDGQDQAAPSPLQPAIDVAFGGGLIKRQYQMVESHARQRQGTDDDQAAGRRQAAHECQ